MRRALSLSCDHHAALQLQAEMRHSSGRQSQAQAVVGCSGEGPGTLMTPSDFYLVLVLGFASSLHCVQMCGPVVLTYSVAANSGVARKPLLGLHLAYNAGRALTYMLLGALAGLAGSAMGWVGRLAGLENVAAVVAGTAMILTGIAMFG